MKKNILLIFSKYSSSEKDLYLTNDLARAYASKEFNVTVVAFGDDNAMRSQNHLEEHIIKIKSGIKFLKYFFIWHRLISCLLLVTKQRKSFDHVIMISPLSVMWPAAIAVRFMSALKKTVIIFDVFPISHVQTGAIPRILNKPTFFFERFLMGAFNNIAVLGERNKAYINDYYFNGNKIENFTILGLWGSDKKNLLPKKCSTPLKVVFGGQLIKGRAIETLINFLETLNKQVPFTLDIFSQGDYFEELKVKYSYEWLSFKPRLDRDSYLTTIADYDIGLVVTDPNANLPTLPSKIIDYLSCGLRVFGLVESESELYSYFSSSSIIYLNSFVFNEEELNKTTEFFRNMEISDKIFSEFRVANELFLLSSAVSRLES